MTPQPEIGVSDLLSSVLYTLEHEIAPAVAEPYAASLCKTSAALLRSCLVRVEQEGSFLAEDNLALREILGEIAETAGGDAAGTARSALATRTEGCYPSLAQLAAEGARLRAALARAMGEIGSPGDSEKADAHVRAYIAKHIRGQAPWMEAPFEGEIR
jgi:hypothetical protein